ncbi:hypothetical protein AD428_19375 [Achromobacter sp. DMS1]|nr:hypothetical protein AD428_19375 [Achromobacter sp. DMS1]
MNAIEVSNSDASRARRAVLPEGGPFGPQKQACAVAGFEAQLRVGLHDDEIARLRVQGLALAVESHVSSQHIQVHQRRQPVGGNAGAGQQHELGHAPLVRRVGIVVDEAARQARYPRGGYRHGVQHDVEVGQVFGKRVLECRMAVARMQAVGDVRPVGDRAFHPAHRERGQIGDGVMGGAGEIDAELAGAVVPW